jgi:Circularly permuted ATP-grasp type 2
MDAIGAWNALLRPDEELTRDYCARFAASMRQRRLTFGERVHCPFLRPFFLSEADEARMRTAAETIAALGERVTAAALESPALFEQLSLTEAEARLVRMDPGYGCASTASRLDAFLLPDDIHFAEYNAESPAGLGYTERLCELFDALPVMARFRSGRRVRFNPTIEPMLDALVASYREWGGRASPPRIAIVDWREVPTWTEFEILRDAFTSRGVPTIVCDPRELSFENGMLRGGADRIDLVYRRVLINDIVARPDECGALVRAYQARAVCVANTFRCKLAHKKAFFAVLTDERNEALFSAAERAAIAAHVPWTRVLADRDTLRNGRRRPLQRIVEDERESLVLKPNDEYGGTGVTLGWEASASAWTTAVNAALSDAPGTWVVQQRIPIRRETFPMFDDDGDVAMRDMLVDFAPYLFRGRMAGYLTRLSATGLANVTSGGGQVPAFVVSE